MGGQAFKAPRLNGFMLEPEELIIVGGDGPNDVANETEDGETHFLADERVSYPLSEEFVANVMAIGVKKNIIVTKIGEQGYVVDGRQRVRAAREANKRLKAMGEPPMRVPVVQQKGEEPLIMMVGVSTNEFNHGDSQMTKARKAQRLRDRGLTDEEIATAFGVTTKAVSNWEKLLSLSAPVKKEVQKGTISPSAAAQLHDLPAPAQKEQLEKLIEQGKATGKAPTIKDAKSASKKAKGQTTGVAPSKKVLRALVERSKDHEALSEDFIAGVAFAIGLRDSKSVNGLSAALKAIQEAKTAKQSKGNGAAGKGSDGEGKSKGPKVAKKRGSTSEQPSA